MNANTNRPVSIERASAVAPIISTKGYGAKKAEQILAGLHEPDATIQRYRAPDILIFFLKTL